MSRAWRSLRVQLAVVGFVAIYVPVLLLLGVTLVTENETAVVLDGVEVVSDTSTRRSPWVAWTAVALGPAAAAVAWWWAGRAVGPLQRAAEAQRRLIEETSHELRTPLAVLAANADVVLAHPEPTTEVYRQGLERSRAMTARLQTTIDQLLVEARGRARTIDRQPADLMAIARRVVEEAQVLATTRRIDVSLTGPAHAACPLDEPTVRRAVSNLVDNALRYAPEGSTVEVAVEVTDTEARAVVTDHGPGIPRAAQARIFERFWRGHHDGDGIGLGLPIASQVALAHGGDLTLRSPGPGGDGSAFQLRLRR